MPWILLALVAGLGIGYYSYDEFRRVTGFITAKISVADPSSLVGRASVIDGDTIEIHGERVRFNGIDAPELAQTCEDGSGRAYRCGARVANAVDQFLGASSPTRCEFIERDRYGRLVGDCFRADGASVQQALVRNGWAMDWPQYSGGAYADQQAAAKSDRIGIWVGNVQPPWEWRGEQRQIRRPAPIAPLTRAGASGDCNIKGNIASDGERIYHVPGQEYYSKTRISEGKGERWFCSEAEAREAGWRAARR